jgi:hypothetical protein
MPRDLPLVAITLAAALGVACGQETGRSSEPPLEPPKSVAARTPTEVAERLRSLGPNVAVEETSHLCLRLRKTHGSDSIPPDLRQQCAKALLHIAELVGPTSSKEQDQWIALASEFGATPAAIARAKRLVVTSKSKQRQAGAAAATPREPTRASDSEYNGDITKATTSERLTKADIAWHALNTYGWDCEEVLSRGHQKGDYFIVRCSSGVRLRVYPRAGQHPRITNIHGRYD